MLWSDSGQFHFFRKEAIREFESHPKLMAKNPEVKQFFDIIRTALIGKPVGPSISVILKILGREEALRRLEEAQRYIEEHK